MDSFAVTAAPAKAEQTAAGLLPHLPQMIETATKNVKETLQVFQERGVLHQREYEENVPAALHGAPATEKARTLSFYMLKTSA